MVDSNYYKTCIICLINKYISIKSTILGDNSTKIKENINTLNEYPRIGVLLFPQVCFKGWPKANRTQL